MRGSPNRLQRTVLSSHLLSAIAVGVLAAAIPAFIALITTRPSARLLVFPAVGLIFGVGVYLFSSARHLAQQDRLDTVVLYPSWSLPRPRSDRQRTALWIFLVGLLIFAAGRVVALLTGALGWTPWVMLVIDVALIATVAVMLRQPPAAKADAPTQPLT